MDRDIIIEIMDKFSRESISWLKIEDKDFTIELEKELTGRGLVEKTEDIQVITGEEKSEYFQVRSPLVGIYYEAPGPDMEAFVKVGDRVEEGDTLYIVEAMKMINEISSPVSGVVKKIHGKNEELVQYDDLVMEIDNHA